MKDKGLRLMLQRTNILKWVQSGFNGDLRPNINVQETDEKLNKLIDYLGLEFVDEGAKIQRKEREKEAKQND